MKYKFQLDISRQTSRYPGMNFTKTIEASDEFEALDMFCKEVEKDGRFLAIEDDMSYTSEILTFHSNVRKVNLNVDVKARLLASQSTDDAKVILKDALDKEYHIELDWLFSTLNQFTVTTSNGVNMN